MTDLLLTFSVLCKTSYKVVKIRSSMDRWTDGWTVEYWWMVREMDGWTGIQMDEHSDGWIGWHVGGVDIFASVLQYVQHRPRENKDHNMRLAGFSGQMWIVKCPVVDVNLCRPTLSVSSIMKEETVQKSYVSFFNIRFFFKESFLAWYLQLLAHHSFPLAFHELVMSVFLRWSESCVRSVGTQNRTPIPLGYLHSLKAIGTICWFRLNTLMPRVWQLLAKTKVEM